MQKKIILGLNYDDPPQKLSAFQKTTGWKDALHPPVKFVPPDRKYIHDKIGYPKDIEILKPAKRKQPPEILTIMKFYEAPRKETELDPHKMFEPSRAFTILVNSYLDRPDERETIAYNAIRKYYLQPAINRFEITGLANIISQEVEDFLTNWASRIKALDEQKYISKGKRFTPDICLGLIDRLQLDPHNPRDVLDLLFHELFQFASQIPRQRGWGQITVEGSELLLEVNERAFTTPKLESFDEDRWIELE